ncbi:MAG: hypothetical protein Tsb0019_01250 [Roseibium sp.]
MKLISNWRRILRRTWSVRLMALATVLSGAEACLPVVGADFEPGRFATISFFVTAGACVARILVQKDLHDET